LSVVNCQLSVEPLTTDNGQPTNYSFLPAFGVSSTFGIGAGIVSAGRGASLIEEVPQVLQPPELQPPAQQLPPPQKSSKSQQQSQTPWVARQPSTAPKKPIAKREKNERRMACPFQSSLKLNGSQIRLASGLPISQFAQTG
jgi:hypothetical protein